MRDKQFNIRIKKETYEDVRVLSKLKDKSMTQLVEDLIIQALNDNRADIETLKSIMK